MAAAAAMAARACPWAAKRRAVRTPPVTMRRAKAWAAPAAGSGEGGAVEAPKLTGLTPKRVAGVPPPDAFNNNGNDFTNIEGAVWFEDALYVSEIAASKANPPPSRILKITADDQVSIAVPENTGSNG